MSTRQGTAPLIPPALLRLAGQAHDILTLHAEESLSTPWHGEVSVRTDARVAPADWLGQPAQLVLPGVDASTPRVLSGLVRSVQRRQRHAEAPTAHHTLVVRLASHLARLAHTTDARALLGLRLTELVCTVCTAHGLRDDQLVFALSRDDTVRPYTVQAMETDLDFLHRVLARAGVYYYSRTVRDEEQLVFTDAATHCPWYAGAVLTYRPPDALTPARTTPAAFHRLSRCTQLLPATHAVHDAHAETAPDTPFRASQRALGAVPTQPGTQVVHTAPGASAQDEAEAFARQAAQAAAVQADVLHFAGTVTGLGAAMNFSLDARDFSRYSSGDFFIIGLTHHLDQRATQVGGAHGQGERGKQDEQGEQTRQADAELDAPYTCTGQAVARATAYRPRLPAFPDLPMTFTARIESDGPYARLDAQGRYRLRALFDTAMHEHTEASVGLRRLTPYGGPPGHGDAPLPCGLHTPLHDGDEVLLGCLNGDPDRPYVVGTLPNAERPSPVTARNKTHNTLRTGADNALDLDDTRQAEAIALRTYAGHTILQLDAARLGQRIALAARHGAMHLFAQQTQHLHAGTDLNERVGDTRAQIVEDAHTTTTRSAEIHHQGATDIDLNAHASVTTASGTHTALRGAKRVRIRAQRDVTVTVKGPDGLLIHVRNGTVHAQAAKDIRIEGQGGGDITFEQGGGGFKVDAAGHVHLWGNKVAFKGPVNYQGPVHYEDAASVPPAVSVAPAKTPPGFPALDANTRPEDVTHRNIVLHIDRPAGTNPGTPFTLSDSRGGYQQVRNAADDLDPNNAQIDLCFDAVPLPGYYTLHAGEGSNKQILFERLALRDDTPRPSGTE